MSWADVEAAFRLGLYTVIGAAAAYAASWLNARKQAIDEGLKRNAAFDAAAVVEDRVQRGARLSANTKLDMALALANETTPTRVKVKAADIEAALPRVRASLATPTSSFPPPAAEDRPTPIRGRTT